MALADGFLRLITYVSRSVGGTVGGCIGRSVGRVVGRSVGRSNSALSTLHDFMTPDTAYFKKRLLGVEVGAEVEVGRILHGRGEWEAMGGRYSCLEGQKCHEAMGPLL